ncbi:ARS-binding protein 2 [Microsporum canis CBS 113480]|uniref:ARS-binding protein 2 n=1 Tax=Arthroderma otae (strain ATCC MYA-4605 / CBS 113480) TaxID=554155 RepID=C5FVQ2_ARTOC|nr:ARS-binding protein 2 [Microsporum canis CBS 113480]EEQ33986.1 ARS-binding protein 2 [Microsporum canis CBS 113480]
MDGLSKPGAEDVVHGRSQPSGNIETEQPYTKYPDTPEPQHQQHQQVISQSNNSHSPQLASGTGSSAHNGGSSGRYAMSQINRDVVPGGLQPSPRDPRSTILSRRSPSAASMSPPASVLSQERQNERLSSVEPRSLPSRDITDTNFDDAYVEFIMYCNPTIPSSSSTAELRRMFRSPPRSEGKNFCTYTLWELIQKLDRKELKTWIQLAIELGVEPPSVEKKQSTQKVQQYAVRLKRWMRAMHIDAFFEFCLGHQHPYYTKVHLLTEQEEECRDGVPREEDLALRALVPEWKPKRGRKRVDEVGADPKQQKRSRLYTPNSVVEGGYNTDETPQSSMPWSAYPDSAEHPPGSWPTGPTAHLDSAKNSHRMATPERPIDSQAVTSRWSFPIHRSPPFQYPHPSAGKTRGRPMQVAGADAPPSSLSTTVIIDPDTRPDDSIPTEATNPTPPNNNETAAGAGAAQSPRDYAPSRPTKLHLQVPKSTGTPIRLATPPLLLVNGQNGSAGNEDAARNLARDVLPSASEVSAPFGLTLEQVDNALSLEIQGATLFGRTTPLSVAESRAIAHSTIQQVRSQCHPDTPPTVVASYCAFSLGLGHRLGLTCKAPDQMKIRIEPGISDNRIRVHCPPDDPTKNSPTPTLSISYTLSYDFSPTPGAMSQVSIRGSAPLQMTLGDDRTARYAHHRHAEQRATIGLEEGLSDEEDNIEFGMTARDWKQRYLLLRQQTKKKDAALLKYKKQILEAVMTDP